MSSLESSLEAYLQTLVDPQSYESWQRFRIHTKGLLDACEELGHAAPCAKCIEILEADPLA